MNDVCILQSVSDPSQFYTGLCKDVDTRLKAHDAGQSPHTSKYKPWRLLSCHWFERPENAAAFERYLKTAQVEHSRTSGCADTRRSSDSRTFAGRLRLLATHCGRRSAMG